ncbi:hypothetical protein BDAP_001727 [Binucleata daphniae]
MVKLQKKRKEVVKEYVEIDEECRNIVMSLQPVVTKVWNWPKHKYESIGMKNLFYIKRRRENE